MRKETKRISLAAIVLVALTLLAINTPAQIALGPRPNLRPTIVPVDALGPGALYVAPVGGKLVFWTLTSSKAKRIAAVDVQTTPASNRRIEVNVSNITGVFFADSIPYSPGFTISWKGTLNNDECPKCTVAMPLRSDGPVNWIDSLSAVQTETTVAAGTPLQAILDQQAKIYSATSTAVTASEVVKQAFVDMQKDDIPDIYERLDKSASEFAGKTGAVSNSMTNYAAALTARANSDSSNAQTAASKLSSSDPEVKFSLAFGCGKTDQFKGRTNEFLASLKLDQSEDVSNDRFDPASTPTGAYDARIAAFETQSQSLLDSIEPCLDNLLVRYSGIDENNQSSLPDLGKTNIVKDTDYYSIGTSMENFARTAETEQEQWWNQLETRFNAVDRLGEPGVGMNTGPSQTQAALRVAGPTASNPSGYLALQKRMEAAAAPILNYLSNSAKGPSPAGNVPFSTNLLAAAMPGTPKGPCGTDKYVSFNIGAVSAIIGTPWNDQITADDGINLIFGLSGDDCIDAKGKFDVAFGMGGDDEIFGGDGHDFLFGDSLGFLNNGNDIIRGGKGESYNVTVGAVTLTFDIGNFISGDGGNDRLIGFGGTATTGDFGYSDVIIGDAFAGSQSGADQIDGDGGADFLFGQNGPDDMTNSRFGVIKINGVPVSCGSFFAGNAGDDKITGSNTKMVAFTKSLGNLIVGGPDNDTINAGNGNDIVFGDRLLQPSTGDDVINAGEGDDLVIGQQGNDQISGGDGIDILGGNAGKDTLSSDAGLLAILVGGPDDDKMNGGNGMDLEIGGVGNDVGSGGPGPIDLISGWDGDDALDGGDGIDAIFGGNGNDNIKNGPGVVDLTLAGVGIDRVDGEDGTDVIFGQANLASTADRCPEKPSAADFEVLNGGPGIDFIWGGLGPDRISGGDNIDLLFGNECQDIINGDNGVDLIVGGSGDDIASGGSDPDLIFGGQGADMIKGDAGFDVVLSGIGNDQVSGGQGADLLLLGDGNDVGNGDDSSDAIFGGAGDDIVHGGSGIDAIFGLAGNDRLDGDGDSDILLGGDDADSINGGGGVDVLFGGNGNDPDLSGGDGFDLIFGGDGEDTIRPGTGWDIVFGGLMRDVVENDANGDNGSNPLNADTNVIFGNEGNDVINAWTARNIVIGGAGDDEINLQDGGTSDRRDFSWGGSGNDSFTVNSSKWSDWYFQ